MMTVFKLVCMNLAFFGFSFAAVAFTVVAPWYRSFSGTVLWLVKVCLALIMLLVWTSYYAPEWPPRPWVVLITYPLVALTGYALTWVIVKTQVLGVANARTNRLERALFSKKREETEPKPWDGVERRKG